MIRNGFGRPEYDRVMDLDLELDGIEISLVEEAVSVDVAIAAEEVAEAAVDEAEAPPSDHWGTTTPPPPSRDHPSPLLHPSPKYMPQSLYGYRRNWHGISTRRIKYS